MVSGTCLYGLGNMRTPPEARRGKGSQAPKGIKGVKSKDARARARGRAGGNFWGCGTPKKEVERVGHGFKQWGTVEKRGLRPGQGIGVKFWGR